MNKIKNIINEKAICILGYIFMAFIFLYVINNILIFYKFNFSNELYSETRYQEIFLITLKNSKTLLCLSFLIALYSIIFKKISFFIIGLLAGLSYVLSDIIFNILHVNDFYAQKEFIYILILTNIILFGNYIKTKNKQQLFIFISTLFVLMTTTIINLSIDYSFYKYVELNEINNLERKIEVNTFDCEKNNCLIYSNLEFKNIKEEKNLDLISNDLKILINDFKNKKEKNILATVIKTKTSPVLVGLIKNNTEINVFLDFNKLNKLKKISRIYVNFLIMVASTFWIIILHILLYFHNNKKIKKLI
jgi:hypothetical protein